VVARAAAAGAVLGHRRLLQGGDDLRRAEALLQAVGVHGLGHGIGEPGGELVGRGVAPDREPFEVGGPQGSAHDDRPTVQERLEDDGGLALGAGGRNDEPVDRGEEPGEVVDAAEQLDAVLESELGDAPAHRLGVAAVLLGRADAQALPRVRDRRQLLDELADPLLRDHPREDPEHGARAAGRRGALRGQAAHLVAREEVVHAGDRHAGQALAVRVGGVLADRHERADAPVDRAGGRAVRGLLLVHEVDEQRAVGQGDERRGRVGLAAGGVADDERVGPGVGEHLAQAQDGRRDRPGGGRDEPGEAGVDEVQAAGADLRAELAVLGCDEAHAGVLASQDVGEAQGEALAAAHDQAVVEDPQVGQVGHRLHRRVDLLLRSSLSAMHVGLNLVYLVPGATGGTEVVARELLPALVAAAGDRVRFTAFVNREAAAAGEGPWLELMPSVTVPVAATNRVAWVRGEQQHLPRLAARAGVDVLHSLANTGPAWGRFARVVTIHDLIHRFYPDTHGGLKARGMALLVPLAIRRSHRVISVSSSTADDLVRELGVPRAKIDVVPEAVGPHPRAAPVPAAELRERHGLGSRRIVLTVAAKRPHKNLPRLLEALALIPADRRPVLLVPGYGTAFHDSELDALVTRLGIAGDVRLLGWVSDAELEGLYAAAAVFAFPSLYEGFGLPVLEAMARGLPVACSDRGSLREVAGDAARRFDPERPAEIAAAIGAVLDDPAEAERLRAAGRAQAARFTWEATAQATLASYERTLAAFRRRR